MTANPSNLGNFLIADTLDRSTLRLLKAQDGRCPSCGDCLLHAD